MLRKVGIKYIVSPPNFARFARFLIYCIIALVVFKADLQAAPNPPGGISLSNMKTTGPLISWSPSPGATSYRIYRSKDNAAWTLVYEVTQTSYTDSGAPLSNTIYYWSVSAVDNSGESIVPAGIAARTALSPGWNMVSAPYDTAGSTPNGVYGSWAKWAWSWDSTGGANPDQDGTWVRNPAVSAGNGQLVWAYNDTTVLTAATGTVHSGPAIVVLKPGWNIIGGSVLQNMADIHLNWLVDGSSLATAIGANIIDDSMYEWSGGATNVMSILLDRPVIEPWKAYWIQNLDSVNHTLTMNLDIIPPVVTITSKTPSYSPTSLNTMILTWTTSDGQETVLLDGNPIQLVSGQTIDLFSSGQHTIVVQATDTEGNVGSASYTWEIGQPVSTRLISVNPVVPVTNQTSITFVLGSNYDVVTYVGALDTAPGIPVGSQITYNFLSEGPHVFHGYAVNQDGIQDSAGVYYPWTVDTTKPTIVTISQTPSSTSVTISWTTDEPASTMLNWGLGSATDKVVPDDGIFSTSHQVKITGLSPNTTYSYIAGGADMAGNNYASSRRQVRTNY